jgi:hypothetical protein
MIKWGEITQRKDYAKAVYGLVLESRPRYIAAHQHDGPIYPIPIMFRRVVDKLPPEAAALMVRLFTSRGIVDSEPAPDRGVNSDKHGATRQWHQNDSKYLPVMQVGPTRWASLSQRSWDHHVFCWAHRRPTNDRTTTAGPPSTPESVAKKLSQFKPGRNTPGEARKDQVVQAALDPDDEPCGYVEYSCQGTACPMGRLVYDYVNNRVYFSPTHYMPFDLANDFNLTHTGQNMASPYFAYGNFPG